MAATIRLVQGDDLPGVSFYIRDSNKGAAGQELDRKDPSTWAPVNLAGCSLRTAISPSGENRQIDTAIIAIVDAAASQNTPRHLLLGNAAYDLATAKLQTLLKEYSAWETVARGADFPKD